MSNVRKVTTIKIQPLAAEGEFRLHLHSTEHGNTRTDVYEVSAEGFLRLATALEEFRTKIQTPPTHRPKGRPNLRIVTDDDAT